jgi:chromosome segregation ATPase
VRLFSKNTDVALANRQNSTHPSPLNMKAVIILLVVCTLGLGVALYVRHTKALEETKQKEAEIITISNRLESTKAKLEEQEQVAMKLGSTLDQKKQELSSVSNNFLKISDELARTQKAAKAAEEAAKAEMAKRDARIAELETQKDALDKQATDLKSAIGNLEKSIADTEKKLAASEGDREFLLKELKRLQKEKAELERQFNDLAALRTQVSKLKDELSVARRLEWIRMGIYGMQTQKGAERLMAGTAPTHATNNFNLNVELKQDGSAVIVPRQTNAVPATK